MSKSVRSIDAALARLKELREQLDHPDSRDELIKALGHRSNLVAAKAADLVRIGKLADLTPHVASMFRRFLEDPVKTDPGCTAKKAAAQALYELGDSEPDLFLTGARYVQHEPSFGRPSDSAAEVRGLCALGLVRIGHPRQLEVLTDHLMDPQPQVRVVAARGIGYAGHDIGALLLRLKILAGDDDEDVLTECSIQLVKLAPSSSLPFVRGFLDSTNEALQRAAIFALGSSRDPEVLKALIERWESTFDVEQRSILISAIAMHRTDEAIEFLLGRLEAVAPDLAVSIVQGLAAYRHDASIRDRVKSVVEQRSDSSTKASFQRYFGVTDGA